MKHTLLLFVFCLSLFNTYSQDTVQVHIVSPSVEHPLTIASNPVYVLKAKASNTDTLESIESFQFEVDGNSLTTFLYGEYYIAEFIPTVGSHQIDFSAISTSGESASESIDITVTSSAGDLVFTAFDSLLVKFGGTGRTVETTAQLPNHVGVYDSLYATMRVICPSGDCDPWDRVAWVDVKAPDGTWVELIRYITPYGRSCEHSIDLSDYLFLLNGEVEFRVFVDTWTGSWEFALDLEYYIGFSDKKYGSVIPVYDGQYFFGDYANMNPFDSVLVDLDANLSHAQFNMLLSGHGWDPAINTGNAAEFYPAVHQVYLGEDTIAQNPWRDCTPNPDGCSPQGGNWQSNRSGWCPGAVTHPFIYDLDSFVSEGNVNLYYQFDQSYVDLCHPNHPNCVSGTTCNDCDAGYNPQYFIGANVFVYNNDAPFELKNAPVGIVARDKVDFSFTISPNPSQNFIEIASENREIANYTIHNMAGQLILKVDGNTLENNAGIIKLNDLNNGIYFIEMRIGKEASIQKLIIE